MAIVWAFRIAIWGATTLTAIRVAQGAWPGPIAFPQFIWGLINDPDVSDEEKSAAASASVGYPVNVATYPGPFTLALLQAKWSRDSGTAVPEDDAICTFHFAKISGGEPVDGFVEGDFTVIEGLFLAAWELNRNSYANHVRLRELRWFLCGPDIEAALGGQGMTGPPVRVLQPTGATVGYSDAPSLPPQVAITVTEKTSDPKSWGRFFLPAPAASVSAPAVLADDGCIHPTYQAAVADTWETFYQGCSTSGTPVVVYSRAKAERPAAGGGTLPAVGARALTVDKLQVDDLFDVIRSRRYSKPHSRELRDTVA